MIQAAEANIASTTDRSIVIPGHGPIGHRTQIIEYRNMLVAIRGKVAELKAQGRSLDDILAAKPTADYDAKWGNFVIGPAFSPVSSTRASDRLAPAAPASVVAAEHPAGEEAAVRCPLRAGHVMPAPA